uniref:Ig-like domain-containing protein n=1 Tax=Monopterus albus TaxID=43700 RepID=A0A3Q3J6I3_MONAL
GYSTAVLLLLRPGLLLHLDPLTSDLCLLFSDLDPINITVKPGDTITLPSVEWKRPDLVPQDVVKYQDGRPDPENQHPSFKDRVELEDSEMDGDVSLVLRNVTTGDRGTYECHVNLRGTDNMFSSSILFSIIDLYVDPGE